MAHARRTNAVLLFLAACPAMAAPRFWVGGSATWDGTTTANWSATSGGASGASVPTAADDVTFDAASGAVTVTLSTSSVARSFTASAFTGTISHPASTTFVIGDSGGGNFTLGAGLTYTYGSSNSSIIRMASTLPAGTVTFTSAGKTLPRISIAPSAPTVTTATVSMQDNLTTDTAGRVETAQGMTLTTNNNSLTTGQFNLFNASTVNLGSSTITLSVQLSVADGVTVNAGTSAITLLAGTVIVSGPSITSASLYDVTLNYTATSSLLTGLLNYHNLTINGPASTTAKISISGTHTSAGLLTVAGNSVNNRAFIVSLVLGISYALVANGTLAISNADFQDLSASGSASWNISGATGGSGDCGGNSGATFTTATTQTFTNTAGGNWSVAANWTSRTPLCQDNISFNTAFQAAKTVSADLPRYGNSIDWTGATGSPTWAFAANGMVQGSVTLISGMTVQNALGTITMIGRTSTMNWTSAGKTWTNNIIVAAPGGTFQFADAYNTAASLGLTLTNGILNGNGQTVTTGSFSSSNSNTRTLTMGGGAWSLAGTGTVWNTATTTGLTFNQGGSSLTLSNTSATAKTFSGGGLTFSSLTIPAAGSGTITIQGSNTFTTFTSGAPKTLLFTANTTQTFTTLTLNSSAGNVITIQSSSVGTRASLSIASGTLLYDYLNIKDSNATGGATWYAGQHSVNSGDNLGWIFTTQSAITGKLALSGKVLVTGK